MGKSFGEVKMKSLKDKLNEIAKAEVPADIPVVEAKDEELKEVKKEIKKVKK